MSNLELTGLNIKYEVTDLVKTIDFYNALLGESARELYKKQAAYMIQGGLLTLTFTQNLKTAQPVCGNFNLMFASDKEVFDRFREFTEKGFMNSVIIDPNIFSARNHSFSIKDPNGITWELSSVSKKTDGPKFFNFPRVNSMWDILKP